jgi:hypothetical protein
MTAEVLSANVIQVKLVLPSSGTVTILIARAERAATAQVLREAANKLEKMK